MAFLYLKNVLKVNSIKSFYQKYEGRVGAATILLGFIFDNLTLRDAPIHTQTLVFTIYLALAAFSIVFLHLIEAGEGRRESYAKSHFWSFILLQFALGSLFSMFFVFYSRGVSISTSWPFLLLLIFNMIGTEAFKKHYSRLSLQVVMLFIAVFSFCIYFVPTLVHRMNTYTFLLSGVLALVIIFFFLRTLVKISSKRVEASRTRVALGILIVYFLMNILYFTDVIPPVPLVMKQGGVYHAISRSGSDYLAVGEVKPWKEAFNAYPTFHHSAGDAVYVMTAVYAPSKLETDIIHNWQYYDEAKGKWISATKIRVPIIGGREDGYRMYSQKLGVFAGLWRVDIETAQGQIVGRIKFKIVDDGKSVALKKETY